MATIDTLCAIVALERIETTDGQRDIITRVVRTYEGRARAEEDLELLHFILPSAHYRIDDIIHIER